MNFSSILLLVAVLINYSSAAQDPVLLIDDGYIRGQENSTGTTTFYSFRGIPYAEPPVEDLRFKEPIRNRKWSGILNATGEKSQCVQGSSASGSEDCLYINVYTPDYKAKDLAVMVFLPCGGFSSDNNTYQMFNPDYFLDEGVVFAAINFRLGIFGFISTGTLECPGNLAIKDQVMALQWVQRNIKYFGGDPNRVVIFGESAGGMIASYHSLVKQSAGLFSGIIEQSGNALLTIALDKKANLTAFELGKQLGMNATDPEELLDGLRNFDAFAIQNASLTAARLAALQYGIVNSGLDFGPVVEPDHEGAVFTGNTSGIISSGEFNKVPCIIGVTSNELGIVNRLITTPLKTILGLYLLTGEVENLVPDDLNESLLERILAGRFTRLEYFGVLPVTLNHDQNIVNYINDRVFYYNTRRLVQLQSEHAPVYYYKVSYEGQIANQSSSDDLGVLHGSDLLYLFKYPERNASDADLLTIRRMVRLWTNFAKHGQPTPYQDELLQNLTWPRTESNATNLFYLDINSDLQMEENMFGERMEFWDWIFNTFSDNNKDFF